MAYGIIENGIVINAAEASHAFAASQGWIELTGGAGIGWIYAEGAFTPQPTAPLAIPMEVSAVQAKTALFAAGLYDAVETALGASPYALIRIWWGSAQVWRRDNPYIWALAVELGLSDDQVDALFVAAAAVQT